MIQHRTMLQVADNSGAKLLQVIHVYGGSKRTYGYLGDIVLCTIKKVMPNSQFKKGDLVKVVLVRAKKETRRKDGSYIRFSENAGVVLENDKDKNPIGTRIFGPIAREVKEREFQKIASLAKNVV